MGNGASVEGVHAAKPLTVSTDDCNTPKSVLDRVSEIEAEYTTLERSVFAIEAQQGIEDLEMLLVEKNLMAQIIGNVDSFQFNKVKSFHCYKIHLNIISRLIVLYVET
jgi:hypothetical protein